ncbi:hypothetical protein ACIQC5_13730 [Paenarthrobacter sp. NPDC092416]|uniref:hypothetical protein n=1 Tax=Paenarthrobacter sp. NPDC092416 TaxID=3364386 RepID=UPI00382CC523
MESTKGLAVSLVEEDVPSATPDQTRAELLERTGRSAAPILKAFVQNPDRRIKDRSGPLSEFVRNGDLRGLRAFLLLHAMISSGGKDHHDWSTSLPIGAWARAFDTTAAADKASARAAVSKILRRLEDRKLITRARVGKKRLVKVTILRPDGHGGPYTRPGKGNADRFLPLDNTFWTDHWFQQLKLPETAMLLVALHEKPGFEVATEKFPEWYGWSADTAERGFGVLADLGLLRIDKEKRTSALSDTGTMTVNIYTLTGPFAHKQSAAGKGPQRETPRLGG